MAALTLVTTRPQPRYWCRWTEPSGVVTEVTMTQAAYRALADKDAGPPPRPQASSRDATWMAAEVAAFSTTDDRLGLGEYRVVAPDRVMVGIGEHEPVFVRGTEAEFLSASLDLPVTVGADTITLRFRSGVLTRTGTARLR